MSSSVVEVENLSYAYGSRLALDEVSLKVEVGEVFGLLGPNGGGKTTLFRILSTMTPFSKGKVEILGRNLRADNTEIRKAIGIVFQSPSLDKKLTVKENLRHQGHLYGLSGSSLGMRMDEMLERVGLQDRRDELIEKLSGGLQRRVEVAKALLHRPKLLLLDEPTVGLDPGARKDLWEYLLDLRKCEGTTILVTTHLMEEAEKCDRLGILDRGKLVALDRPEILRASIGGEVIIARSKNAVKLCDAIRSKFGGNPQIFDDSVRLERSDAHQFSVQLVENFPGEIEAITIGKPTLEDVFIHLTGHHFWTSKSL